MAAVSVMALVHTIPTANLPRGRTVNSTVRDELMKKKVLIVHRTPNHIADPPARRGEACRRFSSKGTKSCCRTCMACLEAVFDETRLPSRADPQRLSFIKESGMLYSNDGKPQHRIRAAESARRPTP